VVALFVDYRPPNLVFDFRCGRWGFQSRNPDSPCGLVVRVPGCRSRGPGSIPGIIRFSEKQWAGTGIV
jgi:hypothetical protein